MSINIINEYDFLSNKYTLVNYTYFNKYKYTISINKKIIYTRDKSVSYEIINLNKQIKYYEDCITKSFNESSSIEYSFEILDENINFWKSYALLYRYVIYSYRYYFIYNFSPIINELIIKKYIYAYGRLDKIYSESTISSIKFLLGITNFRIVNYI